MNKITYTIHLSFNLGNMVSEVGHLEENVNSTLAKFGIDDKLVIRSKAFSMSLQCDRELTKQEKQTMKEIVENCFNERFKEWNFKVESFRRQSCNKSCSKSRQTS